MDEYKHTPGPWGWSVDNDDTGKEFKINCTPRIEGGHQSNGASWICSVWTPKTGKRYSCGHRTRTLRDFVEAQANAFLIAAAPDLLEALEATERYMTETGVSHEYPVMTNARAAIAKATGQEI